MSAAGAEAVQQCSNHNNQWCCNANRVDVRCCDEEPEPRPFFNLQDGEAYATIGRNQASEAPNLATITGSALSGSGGGNNPRPTSTNNDDDSSSDSPQTTESPSTDSNSDSDSPSSSIRTTPLTTVQTSVISGSDGLSTAVRTSTIPPTETAASGESDPNSDNNDDGGSNIPLIVGCAVGIPLALAFIGIMIWLLRKRRAQETHQNLPSPDMYENNPSFAGGANFGAETGAAAAAAMAEKNRHSAHSNAPPPRDGVSELMGQSVGPDRPVSTVKGYGELASGDGFAPGTVPYGPNTVGVGGGTGTSNTSWGSAPPGYSPGQNQQAWANGRDPTAGLAEAPDTSVPRPGSGGAAAAGVTEGGRYIPYRPPQGTGGAALPDVAEMPAVQTPPEERGRP